VLLQSVGCRVALLVTVLIFFEHSEHASAESCYWYLLFLWDRIADREFFLVVHGAHRYCHLAAGPRRTVSRRRAARGRRCSTRNDSYYYCCLYILFCYCFFFYQTLIEIKSSIPKFKTIFFQPYTLFCWKKHPYTVLHIIFLNIRRCSRSEIFQSKIYGLVRALS